MSRKNNNNDELEDGTKRELAFILIVPMLALSLFPVTGSVITTSDTMPLGTWFNMPPASACSTGNFTAINCELMGNTSYRQVLTFGAVSIESGIQVVLTVSCILPSNTVGAFLQLQYANMSLITRTNSSNFVNVPGIAGAGQVFIDNSTNWPCPGNLFSDRTFGQVLPSGVGAFIFRVVGSGGSGTGDNPRFSSITVTIFQLLARAAVGHPSSISTTAFLANIRLVYPTSATTSISFQWIATTNGVLTESGSSSCTVNVGTLSCNVSVTFGTSFTGTPNVVVDPITTVSVIIPVASLTLLSAQTVTV